jgi:type I restriction enzyme S subunit
MELKPGYKQTEVGIIPEGWDVKRLDSLADIRGGGTPSTTEPRFWNGDIPWCTPTDITALNGHKYLGETARMITQLGLKASSAEMIPMYSVIMTSRATIGECAINKVPVSTNQGFKNFVPFGKTDVDFLYYLLGTQKRGFIHLCGGSTFLEIGKSQLAAYEVRLPSTKSEQRAIATALSDVDALLEGLDRLIAKKRDLKQAAMQQLLTGKTRLPAFADEWEVKRLGEIADIRSGGTPSTTNADFWDGGIPWCTPTDITALKRSKYLNETNRTISEVGLRLSSAETIPIFSVIMTSRATIGECAINTVPMTTNQGFKNLVPKDDVDCEFLYYLMTTQKSRLTALCAGSTFLEIGKKQLSSFEVFFPPSPHEQTAIATVLADMDAEIAVLEQRRNKTKDIKQAMMQELLTGRTRLVAPSEKEAAAC